jgi:hypothetical protein
MTDVGMTAAGCWATDMIDLNDKLIAYRQQTGCPLERQRELLELSRSVREFSRKCRAVSRHARTVAMTAPSRSA